MRYRFYTKKAAGRLHPIKDTVLISGMIRGNGANHLFVIWPEFENADGEVILQNDYSVAIRGIARMWIVFPENRAYHYERIKPGLTGYFMEGLRKLAECEVIEIVGLLTNPITGH